MTWRVRSSLPSPSLSMPALLEAMVRSLTPLAWIASISRSGNSAQAEPARGDGHSVEQQAVERGLGIGIDFLHASLLARGSAVRAGKGQADQRARLLLRPAAANSGFGAGGIVCRRFAGSADAADPRLAIAPTRPGHRRRPSPHAARWRSRACPSHSLPSARSRSPRPPPPSALASEKSKIPLPLPSMRSAATRFPPEIDDGDGVALLLGASHAPRTRRRWPEPRVHRAIERRPATAKSRSRR